MSLSLYIHFLADDSWNISISPKSFLCVIKYTSQSVSWSRITRKWSTLDEVICQVSLSSCHLKLGICEVSLSRPHSLLLRSSALLQSKFPKWTVVGHCAFGLAEKFWSNNLHLFYIWCASHLTWSCFYFIMNETGAISMMISVIFWLWERGKVPFTELVLKLLIWKPCGLKDKPNSINSHFDILGDSSKCSSKQWANVLLHQIKLI